MPKLTITLYDTVLWEKRSELGGLRTYAYCKALPDEGPIDVTGLTPEMADAAVTTATACIIRASAGKESGEFTRILFALGLAPGHGEAYVDATPAQKELEILVKAEVS